MTDWERIFRLVQEMESAGAVPLLVLGPEDVRTATHRNLSDADALDVLDRIRRKHEFDWMELVDIWAQEYPGEACEVCTSEQPTGYACPDCRGIVCKFCKAELPVEEAHLHQGEYVGPCCWDERLRSTE